MTSSHQEELVKLLREHAKSKNSDCSLAEEAADEIESLEQQIEELANNYQVICRHTTKVERKLNTIYSLLGLISILLASYFWTTWVF